MENTQFSDPAYAGSHPDSGANLLAVSAQGSHVGVGLPVPPGPGQPGAWQFAQNVAGQIWLCLGLTLTAVFAIVCICLRNRGVETLCQAALICIIVEDLLVFASMVPTEVLLTRRFDRLGRWREPAQPKAKRRSAE